MGLRVRGTVATGAVLLATACDPQVWTEREQLVVHSNLSESYFLSGDPVLRGASVCLDYAKYRIDDEPPRFEDDDENLLSSCYRASLRGPAAFDADGCIALDQLGQVELELERIACALPDTFGDDLVRFEVVGAPHVRGAFREAVPVREEYSAYFDIEDPASDQPGVVPREGEPLFVIEGTVAHVQTCVVIGSVPAAVAVTDGSASASAVVVAGSPTFTVPQSPSMSVEFDAHAGDVFRTSLHTTVGALDVGEVHVVSRSAIAELTLWPSALYILEPHRLDSAGATAIARDREGHVLRDPLATWSVIRGDYELESSDFDEDGRPDPNAYAHIADACAGARANERRTATLAADLDMLHATVDVSWSCPADADDGCGCTAAPERISLLGPWLLLALLRATCGRGRAARESMRELGSRAAGSARDRMLQ